MARVSEEKVKETLKANASKVTADDLNRVLERQKEIEDKFAGDGPLSRFVDDAKLLFSVLGDYVRGEYREIPWWSMAAIAAALLYVLAPVDLIPDFIPVIGYVDDAMVVAVCLRMIEADLHAYRTWKTKNA